MNTGEEYRSKNTAIMCKLWFAFFAYTVLVAMAVQLVILPHIFPAWHAGNGLLIGGDWLRFHQLAVETEQKIIEQGWSYWELRPEGQAPAGIAAAVYTLTVPQPWTVTPINAALHATAGLVLLGIIQLFIPCWKRAVFFVLPFLLYPSAMTWYTQNHKDGFFIAGSFLFVYALILLSRLETWQRGWRLPLMAGFLFLSGCILVWIVRPYGAQMLQLFGLFICLLLAVVFLNRGIRGVLPWRQVIAAILLFCIVLAGITPLTRGGVQVEAPPPEVFWEKTSWLPSLVEYQLYTLSRVREGFRLSYPDAGSNIDVDISFHGAKEIIRYLPRAAQIVLLAPFPNQWFNQGTLEPNTMMRRVSAIEMTGVYFSLAFLPFTLWYWRRRVEIWIALIFGMGMMIIYGLTISNIGTLYRMRYGYIMMMVALGLAGLSEVRKNYLGRRQNTHRQQGIGLQ